MELFKNLSPQEEEKLLKFPVYIALLASNADGAFDDIEKKSAIELTHIRSYQSKHSLSEFYKKAELVFEKNILEIDSNLPKGKEEREIALKTALSSLEEILEKLGYAYSKLMHESMQSFKEHVSNAHGGILQHFIFPFPIKGITES